MPGSPRRVLKLTGAVAAVQTAVVLLASHAYAAPPSPSPSPSPSASASASADSCRLISGEAKKYCEKGSTSGVTTDPGTTSTLDPLSSLAKGCAEAAS